VPAFAAERLKRIAGNGAAAAVMAVYGNREQEDTLAELYDLAQAQGFRVCAGVSAIAEHSIARSIAAGRPDEEDFRKLEEMGKACIAAMEAGKELSPEDLPGNRPYKPLPTGANCPQPTEECISCGVCQSECPAGAIRDDMTGDPSVCISCMRCIASCPVGARQLDQATVTRIETYLSQVAGERKEPGLYVKG
jgi:ferredoxin